MKLKVHPIYIKDEWMNEWKQVLCLQFHNNQVTVATCIYFSVAPNSASEDGNIIDWIIKLEEDRDH